MGNALILAFQFVIEDAGNFSCCRSHIPSSQVWALHLPAATKRKWGELCTLVTWSSTPSRTDRPHSFALVEIRFATSTSIVGVRAGPGMAKSFGHQTGKYRSFSDKATHTKFDFHIIRLFHWPKRGSQTVGKQLVILPCVTNFENSNLHSGKMHQYHTCRRWDLGSSDRSIQDLCYSPVLFQLQQGSSQDAERLFCCGDHLVPEEQNTISCFLVVVQLPLEKRGNGTICSAGKKEKQTGALSILPNALPNTDL